MSTARPTQRNERKRKPTCVAEAQSIGTTDVQCDTSVQALGLVGICKRAALERGTGRRAYDRTREIRLPVAKTRSCASIKRPVEDSAAADELCIDSSLASGIST